jgi:hypothetical protein
VDNLARRSVVDLVPYVRNPKLHPPEQVDLIAKSMQTYGQAQVILIDEAGEIIAGHGRVLAAKQLGWPELVVGEARGWSETGKQAYRVLDNQLTAAARWDDGLLRMEIGELSAEGFDLSLLGFEPGHLASLLMPFEDGAIDVHSEWEGMPEFLAQKSLGFHALVVHFANESEMQKFAERVGREVTKKTKFLWFPQQPRIDVASRQMRADA